MKFKAILGAAVVLGTMMLASVTAHAATFSASNATTPTNGRYEVTVSAKGDDASETLNGYIIKVTYDSSKVSMEQPGNSDEYATPATFCEDGVFVADVFTENNAQTGKGVVAWAVGSAKTIGTAEQSLATLSFEKKEGFTTGSTPITIELTQLSYDGTSAADSPTKVNAGSITVGGTVVVYGDVNLSGGNPDINDLNLLSQYVAKVEGVTLEPQALLNGDVNASGGNPDINDVNLLSQFVAKIPGVKLGVQD